MGDDKELVTVPDASHVDLYDNFDAIPFDRIEAFLGEGLWPAEARWCAALIPRAARVAEEGHPFGDRHP